MTPQLYARMKGWLDSGDETQRKHAAHRLAMADALEFERTGEASEVQYPPILAQAGGFVSTMVDLAMSGLELATPEEADRRLAICPGCEFFDAPRGRCIQCGCYMAVKAKIAAAACPEGKW